MQTLPPRFDRMLRKYIPQLRKKRLRRHERLFALRHQLVHEYPYQNPGAINVQDLRTARDAASAELAAGSRVYKAIFRLWLARRRFAAEQGNFSQVPPTITGLKHYTAAAWNYGWVWTKTFPRRWWNLTRYYGGGAAVSGGLLVLAVIGSLLVTPLNRVPKITVPDAVVAVGDTVQIQVVAVDDDSSPGDLSYSLTMSPGSFLSIDSQGRITGVPDSSDTANHTVTVRVTDSQGAAAFKTLHVLVK